MAILEKQFSISLLRMFVMETLLVQPVLISYLPPAEFFKDTFITCGHKQIQISWSDLTSEGKTFYAHPRSSRSLSHKFQNV